MSWRSGVLVVRMMVIFLMMVSLAQSKEVEARPDLDSVYTNYLPREGLMPPSRPNFQPVLYSDKDTKTRHNDKSKHELGHAVLKREAEKPKEDPAPAPVPAKTLNNKEAGDERPREKKEISNKHRDHRDHRDLSTGESHLELSLPSFKSHNNRRAGKPRGRGGRPSARHGPHPRLSAPGQRPVNRRNTQTAYQDYDPRQEQPRSAPQPNIFPIPVEFLNQIQGGPGKFRPNEFDFNPSAQIEELSNGESAESPRDKYSFLPEEGIQPSQPSQSSQPSLFTLEEGLPSPAGAQAKSLELPASPTVRSLPPVSPISTREIYREEYPGPGVHTPYSQVPYHDARHTTPTPANIKVSKDKVLHYMAPPNQAHSFGVPPVIVDSTPHPHKHLGGLKTGYFPPSSRVMPRVSHIEAECRDDVMKLRVAFNDSFAGLIYSAGYTHDHDCMYINGTNTNTYEFYIQLNRCGTLGGSDHHKREVKNRNPTKNYMWNTITIQYNPLIEEEWDEHFKITCEYGYDFWKTVTFPFLEVETNTADPVVFTLTPPECFMEIRSGYGLTGNRIAGPVHVGDPVTLLIYMRSQWDGFDILVNDCYAHNGANKKIQLIDHHGCPVDDKLIAKFQGTWAQRDSMYETVIYAHMKTFRFTGTPALYIECDIRMCHGSCPTQPCNWREGQHSHSAKVRRKRSLANITTIAHPDMEEEQEEQEQEQVDLRQDGVEINDNDNNNSSFSESLRLFQSLQVLANEDDREALRNETTSRVLVDEADYCFSSLMFSSVVGVVTLLMIMSGASISLLCTRLRRERREGKETVADVVHTLRAPRSVRSEYVHSPQARIP